MGSVGFGQSEAGCQKGCPEGSWFLRYIRLQTVGSFFEVSLEPLLECVGLRNLVHLMTNKERISHFATIPDCKKTPENTFLIWCNNCSNLNIKVLNNAFCSLIPTRACNLTFSAKNCIKKLFSLLLKSADCGLVFNHYRFGSVFELLITEPDQVLLPNDNTISKLQTNAQFVIASHSNFTTGLFEAMINRHKSGFFYLYFVSSQTAEYTIFIK